MKKCERCDQPTQTTSMSMFNTDDICHPCQIEEQRHPDYQKAKKVEFEEVKKGNLNFPGIGLPSDLKKKYEFGEIADTINAAKLVHNIMSTQGPSDETSQSS